MQMSYCRVTSSYAVKHANLEMLHVAGLCSACHKDTAFFLKAHVQWHLFFFLVQARAEKKHRREAGTMLPPARTQQVQGPSP